MGIFGLVGSGVLWYGTPALPLFVVTVILGFLIRRNLWDSVLLSSVFFFAMAGVVFNLIFTEVINDSTGIEWWEIQGLMIALTVLPQLALSYFLFRTLRVSEKHVEATHPSLKWLVPSLIVGALLGVVVDTQISKSTVSAIPDTVKG